MKRCIILSLAVAVLLFTIIHPVPAQVENNQQTVDQNGSMYQNVSVRTVTLDDDGKTITMQVNETFLLKLGEGYDWNISNDNESVISREVNVLVVRGAQGIYMAHMPGNATLTAVGDPVCRKAAPPCEVPSRLFRLYIVVSGAPAATPKAPAFEAIFLIGTLLAALLFARRR